MALMIDKQTNENASDALKQLEMHRRQYEQLQKVLQSPEEHFAAGKQFMVPWIGSVAYVRGEIVAYSHESSDNLCLWMKNTESAGDTLEPVRDLKKVTETIKSRIESIDELMKTLSLTTADPPHPGEIREEWSAEDEMLYSQRHNRRAHTIQDSSLSKSQKKVSFSPEGPNVRLFHKDQPTCGDTGQEKITQRSPVLTAVKERIVERNNIQKKVDDPSVTIVQRDLRQSLFRQMMREETNQK